LCCTEDLPEKDRRARYLTLGHRWGSAQFLNLKRDIIQTFKNQIAICELPTTFQHAVNATRKLGEKYICIDSLCIIQDDEDDWCQQLSSQRLLRHLLVMEFFAML
jgi:hypothetical protein